MNIRSAGLGEIVVSKNPEDILVAFGLGSCLGIGFYDPISHTAGLLHAVLPENPNGSSDVSAKYVNTGVLLLVEEFKKNGSNLQKVIVRMAGGANMLTAPGLSKTFDIGTRNVAAAHKLFDQIHIRLTSEDIGGNTGRTVRLYPSDGKMTVRVIGSQEKEI